MERTRSPRSRPLLPFALLASILSLSSLLLLLTPVSGQLAFTAYDTCSSGSRLDIASLACDTCGTDQTSDTTDAEQCACATGYYKTVASDDFYDLTCTSCYSSGLASLADGSACVACDADYDATLSSSTLDCVCPTGSIVVEYDAGGVLFSGGKRCIACNNATQVFQTIGSSNYDAYTCQTCPNEHMTMDSTGACSCSSPYSKVSYGSSETCVLTTSLSTVTATYSASSAAVMSYNDVKSTDSSSGSSLSSSLTSYTILRYFAAEATNCFIGADRHACQSLGNMCVLQKYDQSSTDCLAFAAASATITTYEHGFTGTNGWKSTLPFMYRADSILRSSSQLIQQTVTLANTVTSDNSETGWLQFRLYKYSLNGTYLGYEALADQLQLCGGDPSIMSNYLRFGVNYENSCSLNLTPYLSLNETIFYDPYLVDVNDEIYPIPTKVLNLRDSDGDTPNRNSAGDETTSDDNVLTRRFYIVDPVGGITVAGGRPKVLSYLQTAVLRVTMQGGSTSQIRPPVLVLSYGERQAQDISDGGGKQFSRVSFSVEYKKDLSALWTAAYALFGIAIAFALLLVFRRLWVWRVQEGSEVLEVNLFLFVRFLVYLFAALGDLFFIMLCGLTFYCWLFYKGQKTVHILLPPNDSSEVTQLRNFVIICFVAKLVDVLFKIYAQIRVEIFFVDWEKPKGGDLAAVTGSSDEEAAPTPAGSVSVWRKLFAANKWNDLQTARLVHVPFTLFLMIFLLDPAGIGLKYLATAQPDPSNLESTAAPLHPILNFAVTTCFLLVICYAQLFFRRQVTHRYFKDEAAQFVDLLCTSNISALILDEQQHGYYLHGKTVHPHADVSLEEMNAAIRSEERTLTRERGLQPGKDSYEIYVTPAWRRNYDELYARLFTRQSVHAARAARNVARGANGMIDNGEIELGRTVRGGRTAAAAAAEFERDSADSAQLISSALLRANASLNLWLTSFINREPQFPFPYEFGEQEAGRRLLGLPVTRLHSAPCAFYDDPDFKFTRVLLSGIEGDLILFLVLLYAFCNILFDSILVATIVCFIVDQLLLAIRSHWGQINISRKTLLDERFLI